MVVTPAEVLRVELAASRRANVSFEQAWPDAFAVALLEEAA